MDGARSSETSASRPSVVGAVAKRIFATVAGQPRTFLTIAGRPRTILVRVSMTSLVLELVRSDPLETVVRAGVSGVDVRFALHEQGRNGWNTAVSLADVLLMDVRPKAKRYAYTMILAPLVPRAASAEMLFCSRNEKVGGGVRSGVASSTKRTGGSLGSRGDGFGEEGGDRVERRALIAVKANTDGDQGDLEFELNFASFACNLMSEPIEVGMRLSGNHDVSCLSSMRVLDCSTRLSSFFW